MYDISHFIAATRGIVESHNLGSAGAFRRWNWQTPRPTRDLSLNPYGCADAANILYTTGGFPAETGERQAWIATLRGLQDRNSGMFHEPTHHEIHTTAHCIAALELFDARPECRLVNLDPYRNPDALIAFLEELDWQYNPWSASHQGAGLYAALVLAGDVTREWKDRYFSWVFDNTDPKTGFLRKGFVAPVKHGTGESLFPHLAGTFHYLFNMEYERRPLRYPKAVIDACLDIFGSEGAVLTHHVSFAAIDWVFCLTRSLRQCGYRYEDCHKALVAFADQFVPFLLGLDPQKHEGLNDLHTLFGVLCCLAELQTALPGEIRTDKPLKLVLDRRPFI